MPKLWHLWSLGGGLLTPEEREEKEVSAPEANVVVGGADHPDALMLATCDVVHRQLEPYTL
jgi:hypothetical protein